MSADYNRPQEFAGPPFTPMMGNIYTIRTSILKHKLALVYDQCGNTQEAEQLLKEVVEPYEDRQQENLLNKGQKIPLYIADSYHSLALVYQKQGISKPKDIEKYYNKSEKYYNKALKIYEDQFGKEHPAIAVTSYHLGRLYQKLARYDEAKQSLHKALDTWENPSERLNNPAALNCKNHLGSVHMALGELEDAENLLQKVNTQWKELLQLEPGNRAFQQGQADVAISLGKLRQKQRKYDEAATFFVEASKFL